MLRIVPTIEDRIRELRKCEVQCPMVKTLDQQLDEMRILVARIKEKYGIDLPEYLEEALKNKDALGPEDADGLELIRELLEKFLRLDAYIDSLR
jgi:hypothetical protein